MQTTIRFISVVHELQITRRNCEHRMKVGLVRIVFGDLLNFLFTSGTCKWDEILRKNKDCVFTYAELQIPFWITWHAASH